VPLENRGVELEAGINLRPRDPLYLHFEVRDG
jgi:hypothetical protein